MYDPCIGDCDYTQEIATAYPFIAENNNIIKLNDSFLASLEALHESCGFKDYIDTYLTFPASGVQPPAPYIEFYTPCDIWDGAEGEAFHANPCWDSYEIVTQCKLPIPTITNTH